MNNTPFSWRARGRSFKYAWDGIKALLWGEHNARIHICVAVAVIAAGVLLGLDSWEWVAVSLCIGGVLMAEGFNSAIEALADKICTENDPLIKRAKDIAAGAVLLFVAAVVAAGLIIFVPKILNLL
ncbi:MAG: diacylglycerol kinase family protein [Prevotella sp.]|nr:diacylglycerol kinase family protein [Prevotella sp.]MCM1074832.1 diacylglycerol kinase family protein [Ruminococcus sp.]